MTTKAFRNGLLAASIAVVATAFATQTPEKTAENARLQTLLAQGRQQRIESRYDVPLADGGRQSLEIPASARSVPILDDTRRGAVSLKASAQQPPGMVICGSPGTTWDYQQNDPPWLPRVTRYLQLRYCSGVSGALRSRPVVGLVAWAQASIGEYVLPVRDSSAFPGMGAKPTSSLSRLSKRAHYYIQHQYVLPASL